LLAPRRGRDPRILGPPAFLISVSFEGGRGGAFLPRKGGTHREGLRENRKKILDIVGSGSSIEVDPTGAGRRGGPRIEAW